MLVVVSNSMYEPPSDVISANLESNSNFDFICSKEKNFIKFKIGIILLVVFLIFFLLYKNFGNKEQNAPNAQSSITAKVEKGDIKEALIWSKNALRLDPENENIKDLLKNLEYEN